MNNVVGKGLVGTLPIPDTQFKPSLLASWAELADLFLQGTSIALILSCLPPLEDPVRKPVMGGLNSAPPAVDC